MDRDSLENADFPKTVTIAFSGTSATITDEDGADVTITRGNTDSGISIESNTSGVSYVVSGSSSNGYLQITSTNRCKIVLNGVSLVASDGPAISVLSDEEAYLVLANDTTNTLVDSADYSRTGKGTIYTEGILAVSGSGSLKLTSNGGHGVFTKGYLRIFDGNITVVAAAQDALHPKTYFWLDGGNLSLTSDGDGVDAGSGIILNGGRIPHHHRRHPERRKLRHRR